MKLNFHFKASSFAQMMVSFCKRMEWWDLEALLSQYVQRLGFGVKVEILPLVEIKVLFI
jgi:POLQ-like helicase